MTDDRLKIPGAGRWRRQSRAAGERFEPIEGPAYRCQWGEDERDLSYQVEGTGPGIQHEWRGLAPEHVGWYAYRNPDAEEEECGPLTEAEALDWLWRHPPGEWVEFEEVLRG